MPQVECYYCDAEFIVSKAIKRNPKYNLVCGNCLETRLTYSTIWRNKLFVCEDAERIITKTKKKKEDGAVQLLPGSVCGDGSDRSEQPREEVPLRAVSPHGGGSLQSDDRRASEEGQGGTMD